MISRNHRSHDLFGLTLATPFWRSVLARGGWTSGHGRLQPAAAGLRRRRDWRGITGALVIDTLARAGLSVVVLDRRAPACGSTGASTSLISYEIDVSPKDLAEMIGEEDAVRSYRLSLDAVRDIGTIAASLSEQTGFARCPSICLASHRKHRRDLEQEVSLRQRHDLDAEFWTAEIVEQTYGFPSHGALHTGTAGVLDPVRFTRALLDRAVSHGAALLSRTPARDGGPTLAVVTDRGRLDRNS